MAAKRKQVNIYLALQVILAVTFLVQYIYSAYVMFSTATPSDFIKSAYGEFKTLFLGIMAWKALEKKSEQEVAKILKEETDGKVDEEKPVVPTSAD